MNIRCDNFIVERKPGIVIVNKMSNTTIIIDVEIPGDKRIIEKEKKNIEKYQTSRREIQRIWNLNRIDVRPVVFVALESLTKNFEKYVDKKGIEIDLHSAQETTLIGAARILRKVPRILINEKEQTRNLWLLVKTSILA